MMSASLLPMVSGVILFTVAMIYAAVMDVLKMTIPDRITLALLAGYVILAPLSKLSLTEIGSSMAAAAIVLFVSVGLFAMGWLGGGDGKLATAATLWVGAGNALPYIGYTALLGGVLAIGLLLFKRFSLPETWRRKPWIMRLHAEETGVPYAVALGLAGLIVLPNTTWMQHIL